MGETLPLGNYSSAPRCPSGKALSSIACFTEVRRRRKGSFFWWSTVREGALRFPRFISKPEGELLSVDRLSFLL